MCAYLQQWLVIIFLALGPPALGMAQERVWTSAQGGKTFKGELVKVAEDRVTIRRSDGKQFTVPLTKFVPADQEYVAGMRAREKDEAETRRHALRFYLILRKSDRGEIKEILATAAQAAYDTNASFFDGITPADRGTSPRVKQVTIDGDTADVDLSVKLAGKYRDVSMALVKDSDERWGILSLTFADEEGNKKRMEFTSGQTVDADAPPADADGTANVSGAGGVPLPSGEPGTRPDVPATATPSWTEGPTTEAPTEAPVANPPTAALGPPPHAEPPATLALSPSAAPPAESTPVPPNPDDELFPPEPAPLGGAHGHGHGHGNPPTAGDG